jgi:Ca2+-binding EF-hand superfamily protein
MIKRTVLSAMLLVSGLALLPVNADAGTPAEDFVASDADRSGTLNAAEFRRFIALGVAAGRPRAVMVRDNNAYDMAFSRVDRDRNGELTRAELQIR